MLLTGADPGERLRGLQPSFEQYFLIFLTLHVAPLWLLKIKNSKCFSNARNGVLEGEFGSTFGGGHAPPELPKRSHLRRSPSTLMAWKVIKVYSAPYFRNSWIRPYLNDSLNHAASLHPLRCIHGYWRTICFVCKPENRARGADFRVWGTGGGGGGRG